MTCSRETVVGVLRGGHPVQFQHSLQTGQYVLDCIPEALPNVTALDIFVDQTGVWHMRGVPFTPERALRQVDVLYNALVGGMLSTRDNMMSLQRLCELHHVQYTGPGMVGAAFGDAPHIARRYISNTRIKFPTHRMVHRRMCTEERLSAVFESISGACAVYPARVGGYEQVIIAETLEDMAYAVATVYEESDVALVEQQLDGERYSVVVLDHYRGEQHYTFPPLRNTSCEDGGAVFQGKEKQQHWCYSHQPLQPEIRNTLLEYARTIHHELSMRDCSQVEFLVRPEGVYFLYVHPIPVCGTNTAVDAALATVGMTSSDFIAHLYMRARLRGNNVLQ
jgi:D-alanine-D-alanine ligase-like ATP-grasp enzyme